MSYVYLGQMALLCAMIFVNGLFALAEMSLVSSRSARLHQLVSDNVWGARRALELFNDPSIFLSTVQVGITLVGILAGAYGGATLADPLADWISRQFIVLPYAHQISMIIVVGSIGYLSLIVGELVPKRVALQFPERIACVVSPILYVISLVLRPFVWLLDMSGDLILKPFGIHEAPSRPITAAEVQHMARQGHQEGEIERSELDMVERVFNLADRPVRSVMTPRTEVEWLDLDAPHDELKTQLLLSRFSRFPVAGESIDDPKGVVNARDLLSQLVAGGSVDIKSMMKPPLFIPDSLSVMDAIQRLRGEVCAMALVIDQYGGCQGVVTLEDLVGILIDAPLAANIPGSGITGRPDGSLLVDGLADVESLRHTLHLHELPGDEPGSYHTLGGMMMAGLGKIPVKSDHFEWENYRFEVVEMDGRRVDKVLVRKIKADV